MEIYNEKVRDLLQPVEHQRKGDQPTLHTLKLREHPKNGPYVQGEWVSDLVLVTMIAQFTLHLLQYKNSPICVWYVEVCDSVHTMVWWKWYTSSLIKAGFWTKYCLSFVCSDT